MVRRLDRDMAVAIGQRDEIAFGIDHDLLDLARALLEQAAQQVRLSAPRIALDEQARGQQFLQIDGDRLAGGAGADVDADGHWQPSWQGEGLAAKLASAARGAGDRVQL